MIGLFINCLPVRVRADRKERLVPWLRQLQNQLVDLRKYEYSRLVDAQGWSAVPRNQPLFESVVVFENFPMDLDMGEAVPGLEFHDYVRVVRNSFPLTVRAIPVRQLMLDVLYERQRFDTATVARVQDHLAMLLTEMVTRPSGKLEELAEVLGQMRKKERDTEARDYDAVLRQRFKSARRRTAHDSQVGVK